MSGESVSRGQRERDEAGVPDGVWWFEFTGEAPQPSEATLAALDGAWTGRDPRPELREDALPWDALLGLAWALDGDRANGVYGALHGVRCYGARLEGSAGKRRIVPGGAYLGAAAGWEADKARWLAPHKQAIAELLRAAAQPTEERD